MTASQHSTEPFAIQGCCLPRKANGSRWDVCISDGFITSVESSKKPDSPQHRILTPSFCHPHVHLDKCFLLSHPKYSDLVVNRGDFKEALNVTNEAKARFAHDDLVERGRAMIEESISFGVTHMRAFVEVDATVEFRCLDAGLNLKKEYQDRCYLQICVFAQDPIFSYEDGGQKMKGLLEEAVKRSGVEVFGSTPYVEDGGNAEQQVKNIKYAIDLTLKHKLHLDLHIDYNLDSNTQPFVLQALNMLHAGNWPTNHQSSDFRTIVFGHATRLTLFSQQQWQDLAGKIGNLPVAFVGLPTSDLYMMGKPDNDAGGGVRVRGTLQIPQMIKKYGLNAAIGINNVGNAFTPYGTCDPLSLASSCVGIYQAGTDGDSTILLECISSRAKAAIGVQELSDSPIDVGKSGNMILFGPEKHVAMRSFREKKSIAELVYDGGRFEKREVFYKGRHVGH